jgi:hypothetical protein
MHARSPRVIGTKCLGEIEKEQRTGELTVCQPVAGCEIQKSGKFVISTGCARNSPIQLVPRGSEPLQLSEHDLILDSQKKVTKY